MEEIELEEVERGPLLSFFLEKISLFKIELVGVLTRRLPLFPFHCPYGREREGETRQQWGAYD